MTKVEAPESIVEAASWWAENHGRYWRTRAAILGYVGSNGPVPLPDGRLVGYVPDGNAWDGDGVGTVMPSLITQASLSFTGDKEAIERVLSMALEELPGLDYAVKLTVDATAANAVIRAGGAAAAKLLPHRVSKSKLGVK